MWSIIAFPLTRGHMAIEIGLGQPTAFYLPSDLHRLGTNHVGEPPTLRFDFIAAPYFQKLPVRLPCPWGL